MRAVGGQFLIPAINGSASKQKRIDAKVSPSTRMPDGNLPKAGGAEQQL
jgi:hypothetical protein